MICKYTGESFIFNNLKFAFTVLLSTLKNLQMFSRDLNARLTVAYLEEWLDESRIDYHDDIERTLSSAVEYITGHIYHIGVLGCLIFLSFSI